MRGLAFVLGGLLLVGGATVIVVADQQRVAALDEVRRQTATVEQRLAQTQESNLRLAETLTVLRSAIAEQDSQLDDATGFLP